MVLCDNYRNWPPAVRRRDQDGDYVRLRIKDNNPYLIFKDHMENHVNYRKGT